MDGVKAHNKSKKIQIYLISDMKKNFKKRVSFLSVSYKKKRTDSDFGYFYPFLNKKRILSYLSEYCINKKTISFAYYSHLYFR